MPLSPAEIQALLGKELAKKDRPRTAQPDVFYKHGFDKSCLFLLELKWDNLFEQWRSEFANYEYCCNWFKCKGCGRKVKRSGRESHYEWHKRELLNVAGSTILTSTTSTNLDS